MPPGLQESLEGITAWAGLLWAVFIIAALVFVCRWVVKAWPLLKQLVAVVEALIGLPAFMVRTRDQLENDHKTNLRHELTEVLETVTEMSRTVTDVQTTLAAQGDWQKKHESKSDAIVHRIDGIDKQLKEKP